MAPTREDQRWLRALVEADEPQRVLFTELVERGFTTREREDLRALLAEGCKFAVREGRLYVTARSFWLASFRIAAKHGPPPTVH